MFELLRIVFSRKLTRERKAWEETRKAYKWAIINRYLHMMTFSDFEILLDIDLASRNEFGEKVTSLYQARLQYGEVEEVIKKAKTIA